MATIRITELTDTMDTFRQNVNDSLSNINAELTSLSINSLTDVSVVSPSAGEFLRYNAGSGKWENAYVAVPGALNDLSDVTVSSPSDQQVLLYDGTGGYWKNATLSIPSQLADLSDVSITSPVNGQVLTYVNGSWVNQTHTHDLESLTDVDVNAPTGGQFLQYDGGTNMWKNASVSIPDQLSELQDVNIPSPAVGEFLRYAASGKWEAQTVSLTELSDVVITNPGQGHVLKYLNGQWVNSPEGAEVIALTDLTDVTITSPQDGEVLTYDAATGQWKNRSGSNQIPLQHGYILRGGADGLAEQTSALFVEDAGNIGIGTTSPWARLSISGSGTGSGKALVIADGGNVQRFVVQNNGNVGIGTTNPDTPLHVVGGTSLGSITTQYGIQVTQFEPGVLIENRYGGRADDRYGVGQYDNGTTRLYASDAYASASIRLGFATGETTFRDVLTVTHGGNVGIGTTSPQSILHIEQDGARITLRSPTANDGGRTGFKFLNNSTTVFEGEDDVHIYGFYPVFSQNRTNQAHLRVFGSATGNWGVYIGLTHDGSTASLYTDVGNIHINPAGGKVGIKTGAPNATLDVNGTAKYRNEVKQVSGDYTLVAADNRAILEQTASTASTITLPANVFQGGEVITIVKAGTGDVSIAAGTGLTLHDPNSQAAITTQWDARTVYFRSATEAVLI